MTNKIITHTDRFKAARRERVPSIGFQCTDKATYVFTEHPGSAGHHGRKNAPIDTYWEHSPLKDIWRVKTPTIVLVGENDVRVPPPQSVELYRALKSNNVQTHLYSAPREPHGWRELRHRLFKMNVELAWFEKHAMNRDYTWEKAPTSKEEPESREITRT